jgi:putative transposase
MERTPLHAQCAGKSGRRVASAFIATTFAQETGEAARSQWRDVRRPDSPQSAKLAVIMHEAETDVLTY